jgi:hypothetical protein
VCEDKLPCNKCTDLLNPVGIDLCGGELRLSHMLEV